MQLLEVRNIFDKNSISKEFLDYHDNVLNKSKKIAKEELLLDFSDAYQFEKLFLQSLRTGDSEILNKLVNTFSQMKLSKLSECPIQEKKFSIVALITLITRSSISYGCSPTLAYRLSDKHIRKVDQVTSKEEFTPLIVGLIMEFSGLIRSHSIPSPTGITRETVDYIYRNLYEDLSNTAISSALSVHPAYLSSTFKKNVGIALRKFITKARIDEAKHLLTNTDISFNNIFISLHFSNQSYFCKKFKEETGYTPKEYRSLF